MTFLFLAKYLIALYSEVVKFPDGHVFRNVTLSRNFLILINNKPWEKNYVWSKVIKNEEITDKITSMNVKTVGCRSGILPFFDTT